MSQTIDDTTSPNLLTTSVTGALKRGTATEVTLSARQHTFTIDEPSGLGGTDLGANPVEHLLAALASCTVISYQVWAEKLGLTLEGVDVTVDGDVDLNGFFGAVDGVRPGFQGIDLAVTLTGPESDASYRKLEEAVATHCPVADNLTNGVPVRTTLELAV
ncbi:OsmC family protein [Janibacter cremeus]|uniref:Putative OsmC-like protein n=1 Tax=Janibacter cremeus TaxID=1285192 RepID=A0A852VN24_9MICO|nr:OsmC family protein [Janibacter cremeus]NYF98412.1 putative OsmC-like protein [Janibacter cremeus]